MTRQRFEGLMAEYLRRLFSAPTTDEETRKKGLARISWVVGSDKIRPGQYKSYKEAWSFFYQYAHENLGM